MAWVPTVRLAVEKIACPLTSVTGDWGALSITKVISPEGIPKPDVTVVVKVTSWFGNDGSIDELTITVGVILTFVRLKFTALPPLVSAVTLYGPPTTVLAVAPKETNPEPIVAVAVGANVVLGPLAGATNVIRPPLTGSLPALLLMATASGKLNALPIGVV